MNYFNESSTFESTINTETKATVTVVDEDTLTVAQRLYDPCVLNFASHKRPGGYESVMDLKMLINTQEEDLFRRSNLPELMDNPEVRSYYPLHGVNSIYCLATAAKNKFLVIIDEFDFGVIIVPAVVNPTQTDYDTIVQKKIERIFDIAQEMNHHSLVLGAWGCGIFHNDPKIIAELFKKEIKKRGKFFDIIVFAIPGKDSVNHKIFKEVFSEFDVSLENSTEWSQMFSKMQQKTIVMNEATKEQEILTTESFYDRPVLGKILILPRKSAEIFEYSKPWACISVSDAYAPFHADIKQDGSRIDLLQLKFDDTEYESETRKTISKDQAKQVVDFVENVWDKVDLLMIHCNAGISRSTAIGQVVSQFYQPKFEKYFGILYSPNKLVIRMLQEVKQE